MAPAKKPTKVVQAAAKPVAKTLAKLAAKVAPKATGANARPIGTQPGLPALAPNAQVASYRGAVPVQQFVGWLLLVLLAIAVGGFLAAQLLVNQRLGQLVEDTAARVELQAQNRATTISTWLNGVVGLADTTAGADLPRFWLADKAGTLADAGLVQAVRAQTPYIQQLLNDLIRRHGFVGAQILNRQGEVLMTSGNLPANLADVEAALTEITKTALGTVLPARATAEGPVLDILRPILAQEGNAPAGTPAVLGVLWASMPVGQAVADLTAATPLDREGERTTLVQQGAASLQVLGRTAVADLDEDLAALKNRASSASISARSAIDGAPVYAAIIPLKGTPLALLQEYRTDAALGLLNLYKPGLYTVVALLTAVLGALMLALVLHLMAQRNTTRVKLLGQTMEALVRVVEARDPYLAGHHAKVARLALGLGNTMKLNVGERATLYYAAQLAAVGRLLIPREILGKKSTYTPTEREALQAHVAQAVSILGDLEFDLPIVPVIAQMYERTDGSGYPQGLRGHQMHRMAKVLGAADAYTAMTADRAHRKALSKTEALKQMNEGAYDPAVLLALKAAAK